MSTYEKLAVKYGEHDVVFVTWEFVNAYGLGDPRFGQVAFCQDVETSGPRVMYQSYPSHTDLKPYDELPQALVAVMLKSNLHWMLTNPEVGGGNALLEVGRAIELGNWGDTPQPFTAVPVTVRTNALEEDLRKLGLIS